MAGREAAEDVGEVHTTMTTTDQHQYEAALLNQFSPVDPYNPLPLLPKYLLLARLQ